MKFTTSIILIALLSFAACLYLPWWVIAITAFTVSVAIPQKPLWAFVSGFVALFFLWGIMTFFINVNNQYLLAHRMSVLIFKFDSPFFLVLFTALLGALIAGMGALSGSLLRKLF